MSSNEPYNKKNGICKNMNFFSIKKNEYIQGAPDLDDIFYRFFIKVRKIMSTMFCNSPFTNKKKLFYTFLIVIISVIIWIFSGFYIIKEAERGVILRFGRFSHLVTPGLNWKPTFVDTVITVNVESVRELEASGMMLTSDENVIHVEMNVQYQITEPKNYLFSVINADNSLCQATDSALRGVIGKYTMDRILTEGRTVVRSDTQKALEEIIYPYNMGITILDVNFQAARPPEEVKEAFDDAIAARENEQQYIREAEAYANEVQPQANGKAQRILEDSKAYKTRTILKSQGEVDRFMKILPEYKSAQKITKERMYIETMENILINSRKILIDTKKTGNILVLSMDNKNIKDFINTENKNKIKNEIIDSAYHANVNTNNILKKINNKEDIDIRNIDNQGVNNIKHDKIVREVRG